jgi:hypothetical protein
MHREVARQYWPFWWILSRYSRCGSFEGRLGHPRLFAQDPAEADANHSDDESKHRAHGGAAGKEFDCV